jgi:threonine dehydrogenase-like Zn-dependent dehydrogenase
MKATIDDERSTWPLRVRGVAYLPAVDLDIGSLNRIMVRDNDVVFGTVNANRWHYKMAADALARADKAWLGRLITRRVPLDRWSEALEHRHEDIKVVIDFVQ